MRKLILFVILVSFLFPPSPAVAINAVASIKSTIGEVKIQRLRRNIPGRKGLILNDQDVVITGSNAKATILFRDGSEIRLFQNTKFTIEKSEELKGSQRGFFNNFLLKAGSFWGKFTKNRQKTVIVTPTATCGIKGTSVAFSERNGVLDVSLSSGLIELENEDEKVELKPGKIVKGITRSGTFKDKIEDLPFRLMMKPDNSKIKIPTPGNQEEIDFTLQVINVKTQQNISRRGDVFFSLRTNKIKFPEKISLNERGYARVTATVDPFQKSDYGDGRIEITAVIEGEQSLDVGTAQTLLTYDVPEKLRKVIRIDANTGQVD